MKRFIIVVVIGMFLMAGSTFAQAKKEVLSSMDGIAAIKTRSHGEGGTVTLLYFLRYSLLAEGDVVKVGQILDGFNPKFVIDLNHDGYGHGWEIKVVADTPAANAEVDAFVSKVGEALGKPGKIVSLPDHMELFDLLYVAPSGISQIQGRQIGLTGQNEIFFYPIAGDEERIKKLITRDTGVIAAALAGEKIMVVKSSALTWKEFLSQLNTALAAK